MTAQLPAPQQKKVDWLNIGLWLVKLAVLFTSARHVAEAFLSLERAGTNAFWGWLPALATDGGLLFMAWKLKTDTRSKVLWTGFLWFLLMSAFAQIDHAGQNVAFSSTDMLYNAWQVAKIILFAFTLPFLVAFMVVVASKRKASGEPESAPPETDLKPSDKVQVSTERAPRQVASGRPRHRLKGGAARAALVSDMPVMERIQMPEPEAADASDDGSDTPSDASDNRKSEPEPYLNPSGALKSQPLQVVVEDSDAQAAVDTVRHFRLSNSLTNTMRHMGLKSPQGVRDRMKRSYKMDPEWTERQIPGWVQKNRTWLESD